MDEYKITSLNLKHGCKKLFNEIIHWNRNKDLILWSFRGQQYNNHFRVIYPFAAEIFSNYFTFKSYLFENDKKFGDYLYSLNSLENHNIFISVQYLENINEEYIIVKEGNLSKYAPEVDKKCLIFECHSSFDDQGLIQDFMKSLEHEIENQTKLHLIK